MNDTDIHQFSLEVKKALAPFKSGVKRKAQGVLKYDYIVPSGYYEEQWDWDAFFIGIALASEIPSEAIYLKNIALNLLHNASPDGYTPGCITPKGPETGHRAILLKPFIAQTAYHSSHFLNDFSWIKSHFSKLEKVALYREKHLWNKRYDLFVWTNSIATGADNNVAILNFPNNSVIGSDLNSYMYLEYKALSHIADKLQKKTKRDYFAKRAEMIKKNINKYLWNEKDGAYYNMDSRDGKLIKRISFNCIHPLWARIAPQERADTFIKRYVLAPSKLWSSYGIRTLAKDDPEYSNTNMIKPYSNWQGPVWMIANYLYIHALNNYGYKKEALTVAKRVANLCINDIKKTGGMHENYNAETGKPLAAPNFISWNLLIHNVIDEVLSNRNPLGL